jgi:hypothetical protein
MTQSQAVNALTFNPGKNKQSLLVKLRSTVQHCREQVQFAIGSAEAQSRLAPPSLKAQTFTPLSRAFDCRERFFLQKSSTLLSLNVKCPFLMSSPSSVRNLSVIIVAIELQKPNRN